MPSGYPFKTEEERKAAERAHQKRYYAKRKEMTPEQLEAKRLSAKRYRERHYNGQGSGYIANFHRSQVPPHIFDAQQRRLDAENRRDLTATVFGDPPPGFSALDKKNGNHPS